MLLAEIELPAYVLDIDDITFNKSQNKRYTMADIGDLIEELIKFNITLHLIF